MKYKEVDFVAVKTGERKELLNKTKKIFDDDTALPRGGGLKL